MSNAQKEKTTHGVRSVETKLTVCAAHDFIKEHLYEFI